ncbi:MAG: 4Fe-4S binding protein [Candidatus Bathyarchaeota archaeon]|nr:MAG: 4Fe-4S binding protein [Candidatus Bathyarchaeota archaeon]
MTEEVYKKLADALDTHPNGFPRTESGVEIAILKKIFSRDEAIIACQLSRKQESYDSIAERLRLPANRVKSKLTEMVKRGLIRHNVQNGKSRYRLAPFIIGFYEAQLENMDHQLAHLVEEYLFEGGAEGIMRPQPAIHRVLPAQGAVKSEWILPYDEVKNIIKANNIFSVRKCICRVQQDHLGRRCKFPLDVCLTFSSRKRPPRPGDISKKDALALLDKADETGLVHTVSNVMEGLSYICNCCSCCCNILRGVTDFGIENSVAHSNYYSEINTDECTGCGICKDRCQVNAISIKDEIAVVNRRRCIGCGLCNTGCPTRAARLRIKPEDEIVNPPVDFETWELQRLRNRGIIK